MQARAAQLVDRWVDVLRDAHVLLSLFVFGVGTVLQYFHRLDATFIAFTSTVLGFLFGHAVMAKPNGAQQEDKKNGQ